MKRKILREIVRVTEWLETCRTRRHVKVSVSCLILPLLESERCVCCGRKTAQSRINHPRGWGETFLGTPFDLQMDLTKGASGLRGHFRLVPRCKNRPLARPLFRVLQNLEPFELGKLILPSWSEVRAVALVKPGRPCKTGPRWEPIPTSLREPEVGSQRDRPLVKSIWRSNELQQFAQKCFTSSTRMVYSLFYMFLLVLWCLPGAFLNFKKLYWL